MDVSQYLEIFLDETKEHLQSLSDQLLILEQEPDNMDTINEIFRAAHSLKGMAGTMGYKRMQALTHEMENVFAEVRNGSIKVQSHLVDILFQSVDALEEYTNNIQNTSDEGTNDNEHLTKALSDIFNGIDSAMNETVAQAATDSAATPAPEAENTAESEAADAAATAAASGREGHWSGIVLSEQERGAISGAIGQSRSVYGITVYVQESCVLKAARAFLVYKALEEVGEIVISYPSVQDIEDERFDFEFSMIFTTNHTCEEVAATIMKVSEIEDAVVAPYEYEESASENESESTELAEENEPQNAAVQKAVEERESPAQAKSQEKKQTPGKPVINRTVRVDIEKLDVLMNLVSELIIAKNSLVSAASTSGSQNNSGVNQQIEYLESVTTSLHESVMKVRMVPIESVVQKFPKMIRDLSKKLNKKMQLYMSGEETELDRTVVDEIGDPLMHLLRNSADHGLESGAVRKERGKPEVGSIFLNAYQDGNNVVIEVRDDGNGIDVEATKNKAIERGTITAEQAENMNDKDIIDLLFLPSFSTSEKVTDVSGRGVGLDVVKSKIEALSGEVEVRSKLGEGSVFTIRLPLTLAIIQVLMVKVGQEKYAISLGSIQTIEEYKIDDIKFVQSKEVINLRGSVIPLIRLDDVLDVEKEDSETDTITVVIVKKGDKLAGLVVDELMAQQEIVIKSLGKYINKSKLISGATILGDGEIALILDSNALI